MASETIGNPRKGDDMPEGEFCPTCTDNNIVSSGPERLSFWGRAWALILSLFD